MIRYPRRTAPATLTALGLLLACVLVALYAVQMLAGRPPMVSYATLAQAANTTHWNDPGLALGGGAVALLGLILLLCALLPGRPTVVPLRTGDTTSPTTAGASRRGLGNSLRAAANSVAGVTTSRLRLGRGTVAATVRTDRTNTEGLADAVRTAIEHRLDQTSPVRRPATRVTVSPARGASAEVSR